MAWNPSPEVAVARDAAKRLNDAPICVVLYTTVDGRIAYASYGKTRALCEEAKKMAEMAFEGLGVE